MHFLTNENAPRLFSFSADLFILTDEMRFSIHFSLRNAYNPVPGQPQRGLQRWGSITWTNIGKVVNKQVIKLIQ